MFADERDFDEGDTPWGDEDYGLREKITDGIYRVYTPGHGGLKFTSAERWLELPPKVRGSLCYPGWAEEDCETPIVLTILRLDGDRQAVCDASALRMAQEYYPDCLEAVQAAIGYDLPPRAIAALKDQERYFDAALRQQQAQQSAAPAASAAQASDLRCRHIGKRTKKPCIRPPHTDSNHRYR